MSFITEKNETQAKYFEIREQAKRQFLDRLKSFGRGFWAYLEETGETNTKPFEGWQ